ncbi:MAG: ribbon-helix-helix protein, CopG family [Candidatus Thorarchaeota archaeon]|nr:ribbon-helix-helix protein, CopG family [Candidatus Thorarchaeota archaeon]
MSSKGKKGSRRRKEDTKDIISVTISLSLKNRIDKLVEQGASRSRAQLIEDAVRWYLDFSVNKWGERGLYVNDVRVLLEPETISSVFFSTLTPNDQYELGKTSGKQAPIADVVRIIHGQDPTEPASRQLVFKLLQEAGWGSIRLQDDKIVIGSPFYPGAFIRGYLESLLDSNLDIIETNVKETVALRFG